jgi:hypothetical protein
MNAREYLTSPQQQALRAAQRREVRRAKRLHLVKNLIVLVTILALIALLGLSIIDQAGGAA